LLIGIIVSILAIVFVTSQIQLELFVQALRTGRYEYVLPCVFFLLLGLLTRGIRWRGLMGAKLPFWRTFHIMNVAYLVNGVLPFRLGEVVRMVLISRLPEDEVSMPQAFSSIVIERILDLLAISVLVLFSLALAPVPATLQTAGGVAGFFVVVGFIALVILAKQRPRVGRWLDLLSERFPVLLRLNAKVLADGFLKGLEPITQPRALISGVGWTAISWAFSLAGGYVLMFAIFEDASLATTMLYIASAAFAIAVPAVPGNIGTYEASILLALTAMGYQDSSAMLAFAVLVHAVNVLVHASTGIIGFIQQGISLGQLTGGVQQFQGQK